MVSFGGAQFEGASSSERSIWGRRWPCHSPLEEQPAPVHASHNKSCPPQRSVPFALGWHHSLYMCSTQGGGTCPSAWPWLPWGRNIEISSSLRRRISQRLKHLLMKMVLNCYHHLTIRAESGQMLQKTSEGKDTSSVASLCFCLVGIASLNKAPHMWNYIGKAALMQNLDLICH